MKSRQEELLAISNQLGKICEATDDEDILAAQRLLHIRIMDPQSFVTLVGETGSGKSTIINGFLKEKVLPTAALPTTGTITQLVNKIDITDNEYYAINKDGTAEPINSELFSNLARVPDEELLRLQVRVRQEKPHLTNLNIFDTPGYNSLVAKHEEILRAFLPESDVIVYVVNHRTGFGMQDKILVEMIEELVGSYNTEFILVINRCPESETVASKRSKEIADYVSDCYHEQIIPYLIYSTPPKDESDDTVLPEADDLWEKVAQIVSSDERFDLILDYSNNYLSQLLIELKLNLEQKIQVSTLEHDEIELLNNVLRKFSTSEEKMIGILDKFCERWERSLPIIFEREVNTLITSIEEKIGEKNKWLESGACTAYIAQHHIPHGMRHIAKVVEDYQITELDQMNHEMEELANQAIKQMAESAGSIPDGKLQVVIATLVAKLGFKMLGEGARGLLVALGGRGGLAAGMGNLAKMGLKRAGNLFNKTFSREVHRNIGRFFSKEMLKKLNVIITVVMEYALYIVEAKRWQGKLEKKVREELEKYRLETSNDIIPDMIKNIRKENMKSIKELFRELNKDVQNDIKMSGAEDINTTIKARKIALGKVIKLQAAIGGIK